MVVMHSTAGSTLGGAVSTLRARRLGYHYLIDVNGDIWKGAPVSTTVGHAGNSYGPREAARGVSREQNARKEFTAKCGVNSYSIGVSFVNPNDGKTPLTKEQMASAVWLLRELKLHNPRLVWITTHAIVSPGRKSDPRLFDLDRFCEAVEMQPWRYAA